jgi:hypothetical protein
MKSSAVRPCSPHVVDGVIPSWAQAGFSERNPTMDYELGTSATIVALLWAFPLESPPPASHSNKILWVSRLPVQGTALLISAQRMVGTQRVGAAVQRQVAGGPGPSIIDLPEAGCWRLALHWSGHNDHLDLSYSNNRGSLPTSESFRSVLIHGGVVPVRGSQNRNAESHWHHVFSRRPIDGAALQGPAACPASRCQKGLTERRPIAPAVLSRQIWCPTRRLVARIADSVGSSGRLV